MTSLAGVLMKLETGWRLMPNPIISTGNVTGYCMTCKCNYSGESHICLRSGTQDLASLAFEFQAQFHRLSELCEKRGLHVGVGDDGQVTLTGDNNLRRSSRSSKAPLTDSQVADYLHTRGKSNV